VWLLNELCLVQLLQCTRLPALVADAATLLLKGLQEAVTQNASLDLHRMTMKQSSHIGAIMRNITFQGWFTITVITASLIVAFKVGSQLS
jgi:hypothetical protein